MKHTVTTCILSQVKATEMHIAVSAYLEHTFSHHLFCNIHVSSVYLPRVLISQVIQPHAHFKHSKMSQATTKISLTSLRPWGLSPPPPPNWTLSRRQIQGHKIEVTPSTMFTTAIKGVFHRQAQVCQLPSYCNSGRIGATMNYLHHCIMI